MDELFNGLLAGVKSVSVSTGVPGMIVVQGDRATAEPRQVLNQVLYDAKGKPRPSVYRGRWRDEWRKTPSGWKLHRIEATSETMTVDGKPADPYDPFKPPVPRRR
jgi:hypothetical protein